LVEVAELLTGPMGLAEEALPLVEEAERLSRRHRLGLLSKRVEQVRELVRTMLARR
jgi:hypothetical protein